MAVAAASSSLPHMRKETNLRVKAALIAITSIFLVILDRLYGLDRLFLGQGRH